MVALLEVRGLCKSFPGVRALSEVDLDLAAGEIHGLVGENGAGKSTLLSILGGAVQPDRGELRLGGRVVHLADPGAALRSGIGVVHQELSLAPNLSIAENVFAHRQPTGRLGWIDWSALHAATRGLLQQFHVDLDPALLIAELGVGQRQLVEILKAISCGGRVLLLDEPTASLSRAESEVLFERLRGLRQSGAALLFVSHHLNEVFALCDRVTVLRDGVRVGTRAIREVSEGELIGMMIGRELEDIYGERPQRSASAPVALRVEALTRRPCFAEVSFELCRGEIVGLAGLVGAGRTELARAIVGAERADAGAVSLDGQPACFRSPAEAVARGVAYLTEDRKGQGLFLGLSVRDNLAAPALRRFARPLGWLDRSAIETHARACAGRSALVAPSLDTRAAALSGGNQQKLLLGMWAGTAPRVLIADEPTRGVDVGARLEIYRQLRALAAAGCAILLVSSDLPEILGLSDRILVLRQGRLVGELEGRRATEESVLTLALAGRA